MDSDKVTAVATDGHRMAAAEHAGPTGIKDLRSIIIPEKAVDELAKNLEESREEPLALKITSNHLEVEFPDDRVVFKTTLVDGKYPDYQSVIPKSREVSIAFPKVEAIAALERLQPISLDQKARQGGSVSLRLKKGEITMLAENSTGDQGKEQLATEYDGEELRVTLNLRYLLDALNHVQAEAAQIGVRDASTSVLVTEPENAGAKHIIMPMRDASGGSPGAADSD